MESLVSRQTMVFRLYVGDREATVQAGTSSHTPPSFPNEEKRPLAPSFPRRLLALTILLFLFRRSFSSEQQGFWASHHYHQRIMQGGEAKGRAQYERKSSRRRMGRDLLLFLPFRMLSSVREEKTITKNARRATAPGSAMGVAGWR